MASLMAFHPAFPLLMETAARLATPEETIPGMLQIGELVDEDVVTNVTLDGVRMHLRKVSVQEPGVPEP